MKTLLYLSFLITLFSESALSICIYRVHASPKVDPSHAPNHIYFKATPPAAQEQAMKKATKMKPGGSKNFTTNLGHSLEYYRSQPDSHYLLIACHPDIRTKSATLLSTAFRQQSEKSSWDEHLLDEKDITKSMVTEVDLRVLIPRLRNRFILGRPLTIAVGTPPINLTIDPQDLRSYQTGAANPLFQRFGFEDPTTFEQTKINLRIAEIKNIMRSANQPYDSYTRTIPTRIARILQAFTNFINDHIDEPEKRDFALKYKSARESEVGPLLARLTGEPARDIDTLRAISSSFRPALYIKPRIENLSRENPDKFRAGSAIIKGQSELSDYIGNLIDLGTKIIEQELRRRPST